MDPEPCWVDGQRQLPRWVEGERGFFFSLAVLIFKSIGLALCVWLLAGDMCVVGWIMYWTMCLRYLDFLVVGYFRSYPISGHGEFFNCRDASNTGYTRIEKKN